jgi:hypothetical protein
MNCPQCGGGLPDGAGICPECGAPCREARPGDPPQAFEAELLVQLAQANLARLRREYEPATAQCVEILRRYPNNAAAHSLLGDIYRDQGLHADALGWYRLALQLDPDSTADHRKIRGLEDKLARLGRADVGGPGGSLWRRLSSRVRARLPLGLVMGIAVGGLVLAALVVVSAGREATRAGMLEVERMPHLLTPPEYELTRAPAAAPARPEPSAPAKPPGAGNKPIVFIPGGKPPEPAPAHDIRHANREQQLLQALRAATQAEQMMVAVDSAQVDPRNGSATLGITVRDALANAENRPRILQKCLRTMELAVAHDSRLAHITVRCQAPLVGEDGVQREELVLVGDVEASALKGAVGRNLTFEEALKLLAEPPWWHPCMCHSG